MQKEIGDIIRSICYSILLSKSQQINIVFCMFKNRQKLKTNKH